MRSIIRCPNCFTFVYLDARRCHGCGQRIGKRRILTRGSWVFIVLAVGGFTFARGIDLHQEKRDRTRREYAMSLETENAKSFLRRWLTGTPEEIAAAHKTRSKFATQLVALRDKFPSVLPATSVERVTIDRDFSWQQHTQAGKDPVRHEPEEWQSALRVSHASSSGTSISDFRGKNARRNWYAHTLDFHADLTRNGQTFTVSGRVCIDDSTVLCLALEKIDGPEGTVNPN